MEFQMEKLHSMKRVELQRICKKVGIKANMKTTKLIEALMQHGCKETQIKCQMEKKPVDENIISLPNNERWTCDSDIAKDTVADKMKTNNNDETITSPHDQDMKSVENKQKGGKQLVTEDNENSSKATSKIPRLTADLKANKNATPRNIQNKTPKSSRPKNWSKIHQKQFEKMDSLDIYLEKKRKRAEDLGSSNSIKKVKIAVQEKETKKAEKAQTSFKSFTTPKPQQKKSAVKKVNFRRKTLTCNSHKTLKENAVTPGKEERRATFGVTKMTAESAQKPTTPFRFSTGANTIFSPTQRNAFDLKASLAKPLSYKPYTGKLPNPTCAKNDPKIASVKKPNTHECDVKEVKVTTRQERRERQTKKQSKKRAEGVCKRRGIIS